MPLLSLKECSIGKNEAAASLRQFGFWPICIRTMAGKKVLDCNTIKR